MEFTSGYNAVLGCQLYSNHFAGSTPGSKFGSDPPPDVFNVLLANVLGPSNYPVGCALAQRPCPSYCPVKDSCATVVGLPCGTCHYTDSKSYEAHGFSTSFSLGTIAVLNDLGGSTSGVGNGLVQDAFVALNFNGTIDNSGMAKDHPNVNGSAFSWNPGAQTR